MTQSRKVPFIFSLINISLILFLLGLFSFLAMAGQIVINLAIESLELKVILSDNLQPADGLMFSQQLKTMPFTQAVRYVSKEDALRDFQHAGDDFIDAMDGINPFPAIAAVKLKHDYAQADSIRKISKQMLDYSEVVEIYYPIKFIEQIEDNATKLRIISGVVGVLFVVIAFFLILNTVKLSIFSKRLAIRSMQLIGATNAFIRKPFITMGILKGVLAGVSASAALLATLFLANTLLPGDILMMLLELNEFYILLFSLILFGVLIGWFSSYVAVNRYLSKPIDQIV